MCTLGDAEECSNDVYVSSVDDHMMTNYIAKIKTMMKDKKKQIKFMKDQCDKPQTLKKHHMTKTSRQITPEEHLLQLIARQKWKKRGSFD